MSVLAALGLGEGEVRAMLIDPPDEALAEAGALDPRPTVASSLQVAEPALQIAWWPQRDELSAANLSRLAWLIDAAGGAATGWLVMDGGEASPTREELTAALAGSPLRASDEATLPDGAFALCFAPTAGR